jgi:hypothetical protein
MALLKPFASAGETPTTSLGAWTALISTGNSIGAGSALLSAQNRFLTKLAKALAIAETNTCLSGTGFLTSNSAAYGLLTKGGNWNNLGASCAIPTRTRAPYLSQLQLLEIVSGINDLAQFGPANASFLGVWNAVMTAAIAYARCGNWIQDSNGALTYTGATWASVAGTSNFSFGATLHSCTANGSTVSYTVPADYDGQAIDFFFIGLASGAGHGSDQFATYTITKSGVTVGSGSTSVLMGLPNPAAANMTLPFVIRIPTPTPSAYQGATLVCTVSSMQNETYFNGIGFESNPAPLVIIADVLRTPFLAAAFGGWPHTPVTEADINAINAQNRAIAAQFSDGHVICDGCDAIINKAGQWLSQLHPDERTNAQISDIHHQLILDNMTSAEMAALATA